MGRLWRDVGLGWVEGNVWSVWRGGGKMGSGGVAEGRRTVGQAGRRVIMANVILLAIDHALPRLHTITLLYAHHVKAISYYQAVSAFPSI